MWGRRTKIDPQRERNVTDADKARERTMNRAIKLLAAKPRSVAELRERLLEKLWTDEGIVDDVIQRLKEYGYLNDEQYASDLALSRLRQRPQGKRRLQQTLSQKQLDKAIVEDAIKSAFEKIPEEDLITAAIEKRVRLKGRPQTREDLKKFYDHLLRRGFSYSLIREKMSSVGGPDPNEEMMD
jgi:regulatory protein